MKRKKRADGRLQTSFRFNGKRYFVTARTPEELREKESLKRAQLAAGVEIRLHPTLDEFHAKWEAARMDSIKESTLRCQSFQYKNCANVWISTAARRLGDMKMKDITADDIRTVQKALKEGHKTQTVNDNIAVLSHVFADAVRERVLDYNPCVAVRALKRTEEQGRDTIHRALTDAEAEAFMAAASTSFYYDAFRMMLNTGMRCGEIGALRITDIRDGIIHVERTITKTSTGGYQIGDSAKTEAGRRVIPVNDTIREIVHHQQEINRMLDGDAIISMDDLIFKAPERGLLMSTPLDREIGRICKAAGIQHFTSHAFRATFCTRMIASGVPVKTVQEIMGHKNVMMTLGLYGHAQLDDKVAAMEIMGTGGTADVIPFRKEA